MNDSHGLMYEPGDPPTIPPGQTVDDWRRSCPCRRRRWDWRTASSSLLKRRIQRHEGGQR